MRIEVVGGGIAGLAVAAGLQRKGAEVRVRERQSDATQVGSGLSLFGNGFAALRALGPEDGVRAAGSPAHPSGLRLPQGRWISRFSERAIVELRIIERQRLHDVLHGALRPGTVHFSEVVAAGNPSRRPVLPHVRVTASLSTAIQKERRSMSSTTKTAGPAARSGVPWTTDLAITAAAVICAMVMWLSTVHLGALDPVVVIGDEARHISGAAVAVSAAVAAIAGLIVLRGLERFSSRALNAWTVISVAVAAISALGPLSATSTEARGALLGWHGVVAAVVIVGARRSRRSCQGAAVSASYRSQDK